MEKDPSSNLVSDYLFEYARILFRNSQADKGVDLLDKILVFNPVYDKALELKMMFLIDRGRKEEALETFHKHFNDKPEFRKIPYGIGIEFLERGNIKLALEFFEKALEAKCKDPNFYQYYSYLLIFNKKFDKALEIINKELSEIPFKKEALIYKAQVLTEIRDIEQAESTYKDALMFFPDEPCLLTSRAIFFLLTDQKGKVTSLIEQALEASPEDPRVNYDAAKIYFEMGKRSTAIRYVKTALDLSPPRRFADEARDFLSRIESGISIEEQSRNRGKFIKAVRLLGDGEEEESIVLLKEITGMESQFWNAWFALAVALRRQGKIDEAFEALKNVDELFPDQVSVHHEIARLFMAKEMYKEAFPHILYAFQRKPHDPVIMANMGLSYMFLGRLIEAEALLIQAKKMDPENKQISRHIQYLYHLKRRKEKSRGNGDLKKDVIDVEQEISNFEKLQDEFNKEED